MYLLLTDNVDKISNQKYERKHDQFTIFHQAMATFQFHHQILDTT